MLFKQIVFLLCLSLLAACSSEPSSAQAEAKPPPDPSPTGLIPSSNPLDQTRLTNSQTAGLVCPQSPQPLDDFCQLYAKEQLKNKYPNIIQYLNNDQQLKIYLYQGAVKYYQPNPQTTRQDGFFHVLAEYPALDSLFIVDHQDVVERYFLLNLRTGHETPLAGLPILSPDFKFMLSMTPEIHLNVHNKQLKIYQIEQQQPRLILDAMQLPAFAPPHQHDFTAAQWLDSKKIMLQSDDHRSLDPKDHQYFLVEALENTWQVTPISWDDYQRLNRAP